MSRASTYSLIVFIGLGGAIGATMRYGVALLFAEQSFPYETMIVNILGCFVLGFLSNHGSIKKKLPQPVLLAINTGIIGSFTTFSTFTVETIHLITDQIVAGFIYLFGSIVFGVLGSFAGYFLAKILCKEEEVIQ